MANGETDDLDLDLEGEVDEPDESPEGDAEGQSTEPKDEDKRIRDLQSRADKAEARANKLEKLLSNRGGSTEPETKDPEQAALLAELREASLDAVYGEFAELKTYGIDRALIEGTNRSQMRASAASLVGLIKSVETKARNRFLKEYGISAEPSGSTRSTPKDFSSMSDEDFEKELARARSGGPPIWG